MKEVNLCEMHEDRLNVFRAFVSESLLALILNNWLLLCYCKIYLTCILRGPGEERIVDVVPGGTELELQLRREFGRPHTLTIIPTSIVLEFIRRKQ